MIITRRAFLGASALGILSLALGLPYQVPGAADADQVLQVYKTPWCGCCAAWVAHMRAAGFTVKVEEREDLAPLKVQHGISADLQSCHTAIIDGYAIEGHVPAVEVKRLLAERPQAMGLAVPGMPVGSPGMEQGDIRDPYNVILFAKNSRKVFARY